MLIKGIFMLLMALSRRYVLFYCIDTLVLYFAEMCMCGLYSGMVDNILFELLVTTVVTLSRHVETTLSLTADERCCSDSKHWFCLPKFESEKNVHVLVRFRFHKKNYCLYFCGGHVMGGATKFHLW